MNKILDILGKKYIGEIKIPGDKSISIRVFIISNLFFGDFELINFNNCDDTKAIIDIMNKLSKITNENKTIMLDCKNSATTMRLVTGFLCSMYKNTNLKFILKGDDSLCKRPMKRIIEPLNKMGFDIISKNKNNTAPLYINFKNKKYKSINNFSYTSKISSAQVKSSLELAAFISHIKLKYIEPYKSRNHTEIMLKYFKNNHFHKYYVPCDTSTASFFILNALLYKDSNITMKNVLINKTRTGFIDTLIKMGANIKYNNIKNIQGENVADIKVKYTDLSKLKNITINKNRIPSMIDEIPLLITLLIFIKGTSKIKGLSELRYKESNRLNAIKEILNLFGTKYKIENDNIFIYNNKKDFEIKDLTIYKNKKLPDVLKNSKDHRILILLKLLNFNNFKYKKYLNVSL